MKSRNYLISLTALLNKRHWNSSMLWKMIELTINDLLEREDNNLAYNVFKDIYRYAKNCKSLTELEDYLDKFSY